MISEHDVKVPSGEWTPGKPFRLSTQSLCWRARTHVHWDIRPLLNPAGNPHMLYKVHYCSCPEENPSCFPQWLAPCSPDLGSDEVFGATDLISSLPGTLDPQCLPIARTAQQMMQFLPYFTPHLLTWIPGRGIMLICSLSTIVQRITL